MKLAAQVLGHATRDTQDHALAMPLELGQDAGASADAFDRAFAHRTGIDENHIGTGWILRARVSGLGQQAQHHVGVGHIHLAAKGFDVNRGHCAFL